MSGARYPNSEDVHPALRGRRILMLLPIDYLGVYGAGVIDEGETDLGSAPDRRAESHWRIDEIPDNETPVDRLRRLAR